MVSGWKWGALGALVLVVGLSVFGGRTYVDLKEARENAAFVESELGSALGALLFAKAESDSLRRERGRVEVVYRDRVRTLPSDTVLVGLPAVCDECVARSRAQDTALAAAEDLLRADSTLIAAHERTIGDVTVRLTAADSAVAALRVSLDEAARQEGGPRKILGVPLPEVMAGYGLSLAGGEVRSGPVLALGWRVRF